MRAFRSSLTVLAAALYVLLGISASWHAPHFMRGEAAIGVDAHSGGHETAFGDEACALCSTKTSDSHASVSSIRITRALVLGPVTPFTAPVPAREVLASPRARAPPALS